MPASVANVPVTLCAPLVKPFTPANTPVLELFRFPVAVVSFNSFITVTSHVALILEFSADVAVMVASPSATAVTTPSVTVATVSSLDVQFTVLFVAFAGTMVAVRERVLPTISVASVASREIPVTLTGPDDFL